MRAAVHFFSGNPAVEKEPIFSGHPAVEKEPIRIVKKEKEDGEATVGI